MIDFAATRARLVEQLKRDIRDERVLRAMGKVPRELFVPESGRSAAYEDRPLPIGLGQTISQPYIVALMTEALELSGTEKVLEVGTGSGYQAAILAELAKEVVTVERFGTLAETARQVLSSLGYTNVTVHAAGDDLGWPAGAPYQAIMVSAAAPAVPQDLIDQLELHGRLIIPVGTRWEQELVKVTKLSQGGQNRQYLGACRFVPLIGKGGWSEDEAG